MDAASPFARRVGGPVHSFLQIESAGGLLLAATTIVALAWANSPIRGSYTTLWATSLDVGIGHWTFSSSMGHIVNDGLMAIFFFVIGLEIKREWLTGELQDRRAAFLPIVAAIGGMVMPALLYLALVGGHNGGHGWGIPMATDIAFAVGVVAVLGRRVPASLKVFLLTLAIVDDLGAIVVIAVFYAGTLQWAWLATAAVGLVVVILFKVAGLRWLPLYVAVGTVVWFATWQSGIHATIAGVALAFITPSKPLVSEAVGEALVDTLENRGELAIAEVRWVARSVIDSVAPLDRLSESLHPWSSYVIVPLFALANAGVVITTDVGTDGARVALGIVVALVVGKILGVVGTSWVVVRAGWGSLPTGASWMQVVGIAALAGIGFTMSLLVADLAFSGVHDGTPLAEAAKTGVLVASLIAATIGSVLIVVAHRRTPTEEAAGDPVPADQLS